MELCAGTLEDLIKKELKVTWPSPNEEILRQITDGLEFLHSKRIVHRHIKPTNVLVSSDGIIKLTDFGISNASSTTNPGYLHREDWAAPEFQGDEERFDFFSDVFSLGCVFAYTLTDGKHPFGDPAERKRNIATGTFSEEIMKIIQNEELRQLTKDMVSLNHRKRPTLQLILLKLLQCLLRHHIVNLEQNGCEFIKTIDRLTQVSSALHCSGITEGSEESLLLTVCKSSSKDKFKCAEKLLSSPEIFRIDINKTDEENRNALTCLLENPAAEEADNILKLAKLLIDKQIDVNRKTINGFTALGLAIKNFGSLDRTNELIKLLLENGSDPNVSCNTNGWTLINLACRYYQHDGLIDVLRLLIDRGAQLEHRTANGNNALTLLALNYQQNNMADVIGLLIDAGADVNCKSNKNWNALLMVCCYYKSIEGLFPAVKLLVDRGINVKEKTRDDNLTVLHLLMLRRFDSHNGHLLELVKFLIDNGAEADAISKDGWTPLLSACQCYHKDDFIQVAWLLINHGAKPNHRLPNGENALTLVTMYHQRNITGIIQFFIEHGADVNSKSTHNWNALMKLFRYYQGPDELFPAVKLLIRSRINVNEKDNEHARTALHILAMYFGNDRSERMSDIVEYLLENGALPDNRDREGWTPLLLACKHYQKDDLLEVLWLLIERRAQPVRCLPDGNNALTLTALFQAQHKDLAAILKLLIETGAGVNHRDNAKWNALMILCRFYERPTGLASAVGLLIAKGARVNERLDDGWTALHLIAKFFGDYREENLSDIVQCLVDAGADVNARTKDGSTPLDLVRQCYHREDLEYVIHLLGRTGGTQSGFSMMGNHFAIK